MREVCKSAASGVVSSPFLTVQRMQYYPSGLPWADCMGADYQNRKYNGKEFIEMHGLDVTDLGNRGLYHAINRFTSIDRFAEKYPWQSPYVHAGNNPVKYVDIKGDSIAVLNQGGAIGHSALLIQNGDGQWEYFSMNGDWVYEDTKGLAGGKPYHDMGEKTFNSPHEFLESSYNALGNKEQVANNEVNNYGFKETYILPTTPEQDKKIKETFKQSVSEGYNFLSNQCSQVVQKSLNAAGITTTEVTEKTVINRQTGTIHIYPVIRNPYFPNNAFRSIIKNNPKGNYIKRITNK